MRVRVWVLLAILMSVLALATAPALADPDNHTEAGMLAQSGEPVTVYFFWGDGCPHCTAAKPFLAQLAQDYPGVTVRDFEVWNHAENRESFTQMAAQFGFEPTGVPTIFIGERYWVGYAEEPIGREIEAYVASCALSGCPDAGAGVFAPEPTPTPVSDSVAPPSAAVDAQECQTCGRYKAGNTGRYVSPNALVTPLPTLDAAAMQLLEQPSQPVVKAVMFWMSTCPHCHDVIDEVLPPLQARYAAQFQIELIELGSGDADERLALFYRAAEAHGIDRGSAGVPFLLIGDKGLMGVDQIRAELPGLIEQDLAAGGVDFPQIDGLAPLMSAGAPASEACAPSTPCAEETALPAADAPVAIEPGILTGSTAPRSNGFVLAIIIMIGMVAALIYTMVRLVRGPSNVGTRSQPAWLAWVTPILALIGLGVAGYLSYVETQAVQAVCGPVGDCNAVQSSPYARLFGFLPVGVLGALGYIAILAAWLWGRFGRGRLAGLAPLAVFGAALFGVLFSLYLTYLEPFVIGAVCAWCLTSAVIITLLLLLAIDPALAALGALGAGDEGVVGVGEIEVEPLRQGES